MTLNSMGNQSWGGEGYQHFLPTLHWLRFGCEQGQGSHWYIMQGGRLAQVTKSGWPEIQGAP